MPLLFLTDLTDPFVARDDAGRALPNAVLTFWRSGTTAPIAVYSDAECTEQISDARGRIVADENGEFAIAYLLTDAQYRVKLETAEGVLRWDVDPYELDLSTEGRNAFRAPLVAARDESGRGVSNATLGFFESETSTPMKTYADAELQTPHPNPVAANAAGIFPPIYLDGVYRVVPSWTGEIDPYPPPPPPTFDHDFVVDVTVPQFVAANTPMVAAILQYVPDGNELTFYFGRSDSANGVLSRLEFDGDEYLSLETGVSVPAVPTVTFEGAGWSGFSIIGWQSASVPPVETGPFEVAVELISGHSPSVTSNYGKAGNWYDPSTNKIGVLIQSSSGTWEIRISMRDPDTHGLLGTITLTVNLNTVYTP